MICEDVNVDGVCSRPNRHTAGLFGRGLPTKVASSGFQGAV